MTKILSQLLEAKEPEFRQNINELERASGYRAHDIRLTTEVQSAVRSKIAQLGLDPRDTTATELYRALNEKIKSSDQAIAAQLGLSFASNLWGDFMRSINNLIGEKDTFALKSSVYKKFLRSHPPRKAMRALNYRSLDSMLKRESFASLLAATRISESVAWQKAFTASLEKLKPTDFEVRPLQLTALTASRWHEPAADFTAKNGSNLIVAKESGIIALLPLSEYRDGMLTAMFLLAINAINDCLASGSYLKLHQVRPDFGELAARAIGSGVELDSPIEGQKLSWRVFHNFANPEAASSRSQSSTGKPALALPEEMLANLSDELSFWRGSGHLATVLDGQTVSLNPLDVALNYLNNLSFENRVNCHYRTNLWQAFWQRYLQAETAAEELTAGFRRELAGPALALEPAFAEEFDV